MAMTRERALEILGDTPEVREFLDTEEKMWEDMGISGDYFYTGMDNWGLKEAWDDWNDPKMGRKVRS